MTARRQKVVTSTWASDVRALIDAFQLLGKNEILTYEQMGDLIGKAVNGSASEYQAAKERMARDHGVEIKTLPRMGAQRLDDGGIVEELPRDRAGIQRRVARSHRRASNIEDFDALSNPQKLEANRHMAQLGLMQHLQQPQVSRAIDDRVRDGARTLEVDRLVAMLRE
jgi:hypothetical protein